MLNRIVFSFIFSIVMLSCFAQAKPVDKSFTQEDWDKLSQPTKDSINKVLLKKFEEAKRDAETTDETNANQIIDDALKNINSTTSLTLNAFPKTQLRDDITKLKNVEEFTCTKCRALDLTVLFNQLSSMPKLKRVNVSGGAFKVLPNTIKKLSALEELNLKDNNFTTLPDSFTYLKKLRVLNLEHNAYLYDDDVFERIKTLSIEELNFSASGLLELNDKVGQVKSLKKLDLSVNDIKVLPPSFNQLTNLQQLNLSQNFNLDVAKIVASISGFVNLTNLDLSQCLIENLPLDISKLTALKKLNLKRIV